MTELIFPVPAEIWLLPKAVEPPVQADYVAPRIDAVLTPEQIEREILFAGAYTPGPWTDIPD